MAIFEGRVWCFGDEINTDVMNPGFAMTLPEDQQLRYVFSANRPEWHSQVRQGDILVGGRDFGVGSSRPAARLLRRCGIVCLLADSINGLFLRNCVNYGLPALRAAGLRDLFEEGDVARVDTLTGEVTNTRTGATTQAPPLPPKLQAILDAGGIFPLLRGQGLLAE
ncbi:MAG: 3-isopropylmalate dehydratase [Chloroflexota bacterium]|nr:3-isopropylmalate dehydratase [Chloroflexota bacterium]